MHIQKKGGKKMCLIVVGSGQGICTADIRDSVLHVPTVDNREMVSQSRKK